jgi:chemotaxis protein MotB
MKSLMHRSLLIATIGSLPFINSCISKKQLAATETKVINLNSDISRLNNRLNENNSLILRLNEEKASLQTENMMLERRLKILSISMNTTTSDQIIHLDNLQNMIQLQKDLMTNLKSSLAKALINYRFDELSVFKKNGNVTISLEDKLLFNSGSDVVDPKGKEALSTIANVLNVTKNFTVQIENHTDKSYSSNDLFRDSWDLSTARATSIVRILTIDYGFEKERITASGCSSFQPIKNIGSGTGIANNCRTEIILSPDVSELYKFLE